MKLVYSLLLFLCVLLACNNVESTAYDNIVSFYLLKDSEMKATDASKNKIESLQLSEYPIFSSQVMGYYNWKDHSFSIDSNSVEKLHEYCNLHKSVFGIPFIVTVGEERIYLGAFWFAYSSLAPTFPHIAITLFSQNPSSVLTINKSWSDLEPDIRNDKRIYITLKNKGLLIE